MLSITQMLKTHIDEVFAIDKTVGVSPWSYEALQKELTESAYGSYYVAVDDNKVIGYASLWHICDEAHVMKIAVAEPYRRRGVGSLLLRMLLERAKEKKVFGVTLEVRCGNIAAITMYEKHGFVRAGLRTDYYDNPKEDAVIMWRYF